MGRGITMKNKYYWFAVISAFIAMGIVAPAMLLVLGDNMASMSARGRDPEDMMRLMWVQLVGYFLITCVMVYIFSKGRDGTGWMEGARFGALIGLMMCGVSMWMYSVYPWELPAFYTDMFINMVVYTVGGIVMSLVYKPA